LKKPHQAKTVMKTLALLGFVALSPLALRAEGPEMGTVTGDRVNIRGRPLPTAEICAQARQGDLVEIYERRLVQTAGTNTEMWVRVGLPASSTVWLQASFVGPDGAATARVNGRAGPSLMWPVVHVFAKGDAVAVRTNSAEWAGVAPPRGATGWISGRFVTNATLNIPTAPAAPPPP
jgi:hypothetical protein